MTKLSEFSSSLSVGMVQKPPLQWRRWFLGCPLKNSEQRREKVGLWGGLALLGSDALSSVAYASEEILLALMVMGPSTFFLSIPISLCIIAVMTIVILSYRQTIAAYPHGGGAYTVTRHEIGPRAALIAAASLLLDYVLTVAVSIAAGVRAIISFMPQLAPHTLSFSIGILIFLGWLNLRGVRDSARVLSLPMFLFLGGLGALILMGFWQKSDVILQGNLFSGPESENGLWSWAAFFVVLRAFAGGCTAMTGIEAVANAVPIFKDPSVKQAQNLYGVLAIFLSVFFFGVSVLAQTYGIMPLESESLISILGRHVFGEGLAHQGLQLVTAVILFLAANTAFADYPRLCRLLAQDKYLPKQLSQMGDRLVYHKGIILLMILSGLLLILFNANVHHLIPLYALGVMTAFTFSQFGMAKHWLRQQEWSKCFLNGLGSFVTLVVFIVILEAKFSEGAFLFLFLIPMIMMIFKAIHDHYQIVETQLRVTPEQMGRHRAFSNLHGRRVIVPISRMHLGSLEALAFAREMTKDVQVLLVNTNPPLTRLTQNQIEALDWNVQITVLESPYRSIIKPIIDCVSTVKQDTVLIFPEIVPLRWWQRYLHNETVVYLVQALEEQIPHPGSTRVIITVPYHLTD